MVLPGHLAGGYLVTTALLAIFHPDLSTIQINSLLVIGTLAGELPDIDLIFFNWANRRGQDKTVNSHRDYITHVPFFWLTLCLLFVLIGIVIHSTFTEYLGWIILCGTWSHLFLDTIEYGIIWLSPLSKKNYTFNSKIPEYQVVHRPGSLMHYFHFVTTTYRKTYTMWFEIIVTIIGITVFLKSF